MCSTSARARFQGPETAAAAAADQADQTELKKVFLTGLEKTAAETAADRVLYLEHLTAIGSVLRPYIIDDPALTDSANDRILANVAAAAVVTAANVRSGISRAYFVRQLGRRGSSLFSAN